jgi:hypothetical protein
MAPKHKMSGRQHLHRPGENLGSIAERLQWHMNEIKELFDSPSLTLIIRSPTLDEQGIILTNDQAHEAIKAIQRNASKYADSALVNLN